MENVIIIAEKLVSLCRAQQFIQALQELFSEDAFSIDSLNPERGKFSGLDNLINAERKFFEGADIHEVIVSEPVIAGKYFAVRIFMDVTINKTRRTKIDELAIYEVKDGKIISQQFFIGSIL